MEDQNSLVDRFGNWFKTSVTIKLIIIFFLILIMLIPAEMIKSIISEREDLSYETTSEVSENWAGAQRITGPVLSIPVKKTPEAITEYVQFLPDNLQISGEVVPTVLKRGIYEIVVYEADLSVSGSYVLKDKFNQANYSVVDWTKAFITIGFTDMRGIKNEFQVRINDMDKNVIAGSRNQEITNSGVSINVDNLEQLADTIIQFQTRIQLQGSNNLSFIPAGNITEVQLHSDWNDPSFNGAFLPDERNVTDTGFTANWKVLQLNRNYPQSWEGDLYNDAMYASSFGVDLIKPANDYQQSMRSVKYAILILALTFLVFFLVEILNGRRIHPFQYILVGLALCLFYILLVSFSEQLDFGIAYIISAGAIVLMITLYSLSIFKSTKLSALLSVILIALYSFLYIILQVSDYALIIGSIGLTIILALTMFFTRKINWYTIGN
ncbi:MAG: cell envelope integrity protein CreD [Chitinophagales bacterium]|nr:cell envelope integrity protein CreD [Chitinophagales bacterium]